MEMREGGSRDRRRDRLAGSCYKGLGTYKVSLLGARRRRRAHAFSYVDDENGRVDATHREQGAVGGELQDFDLAQLRAFEAAHFLARAHVPKADRRVHFARRDQLAVGCNHWISPVRRAVAGRSEAAFFFASRRVPEADFAVERGAREEFAILDEIQDERPDLRLPHMAGEFLAG